MVHRRAARREQSHHLPVAGHSGLAILGLSHHKERAVGIGRLPAGPSSLGFEEFQRTAARVHDFRLENEGAIEIGNADMRMRQHRFCPAQPLAAKSRASSRRSFPQNISPRAKKVGAPKIPLARASSVCARNRALLGSAWASSSSVAGSPSSLRAGTRHSGPLMSRSSAKLSAITRRQKEPTQGWSAPSSATRAGMTPAALFVILFIYGWNQYLWPLLVTNTPAMTTIVIGIRQMIGNGDAQTEWHLVMATALLALLPPIAVVLAMQRWFVKGLIEPEK